MSPIPTPGLDQAEAWAPSGGILPPGKHVVVIDKADDSVISKNGHPQIEFQLRQPDNGLEIRDWLTVIESAYGKVRQYLSAIKVAPGAQIAGGTFLGKKVLVTVVEGTKPDGSKKTEVVAWQPVEATSDVPADTAGLGGNGQSAQQARDDIPF